MHSRPFSSSAHRRRPLAAPKAALAALALLALALAACAARDPYAPIDDLAELPQTAGAYHHLEPDVPLLSQAQQTIEYESFLRLFFAVWDDVPRTYDPDEIFWGLRKYEAREIFGENTLPRSPEWIAEMARQCDEPAFPSMNRAAITTRTTSLRVLPSIEPLFYDFRRAGEGFPFDYLQNSLALAATPVRALHASADGLWYLVETRFAFGWVPAQDVAFVSAEQAARYQTGVYAAMILDDWPIVDTDGRPRFLGRVGMVLPVLDQDADGATVLVPARGADGDAELRAARLPWSAARIMPLPPTPAMFAWLADQMMGQAYGWGGLYEKRDCSATLMDLFAGFGIYLPRNSRDQAQAGRFVPVEDLDAAQRRAELARQTPFLTLVRKPGHIMLYIGTTDEGEPVVYHTMWGLRTVRPGGEYGRKVVGRTCVTTLAPGRELRDLARPGGLLIETITGYTRLP